MRVDWSNYLTETFFIVLVLSTKCLGANWSNLTPIGATLLQLGLFGIYRLIVISLILSYIL